MHAATIPLRRFAARTRSPVFVAFGIVASVRITAFIALHIGSVSSGHGGFAFIATGDGDDGRLYYEMAVEQAHGRGGPLLRNGYPTVLSLLMRLGVDSVLALKSVNLLVGLSTPLLAAAMVGLVSSGAGRRRAQTAAIVAVGLYPTNVYVASNSLIRDAWLYVFVLVVAWLGAAIAASWPPAPADDAPRRVERWQPWTLLAATVLLAWFRPYAAGILLVGLGAGWALAPRAAAIFRRVPHPRLVLPVAGLAAYFGLVAALRWPIEQVFGRDPLDYRTTESLLGGSSLGLRYDHNPVVNLGVYFYSVACNMFGPLPWDVDTPAMLVPLLVELPLLICVVWVLARWKPDRVPLPVRMWLFGAALWFATLGLWNDNLGAALRLRAPAWLLLMVCACAYLSTAGERSASPAPGRDP